MSAAAARRERRADGLPSGWSPRVEVHSNPVKGRGVFARAAIPAGALIDAAPVIVVPAAQCALLDQMILHDYYFRWQDNAAAVALGLVSLCNHSRRPRARVRRNLAHSTLELVALATIAAGEEVTIDYNCPLWFDPQD